MTAWADTTFARRHWADAASIDDVRLAELLETATDQCQAFAPGFPDPAPVVVAPPTLTSLAPLRLSLANAGRSAAVQVLGDSTGNDPTDWVYTLAQAVAAAYPSWTVVHRLWSDASQQYAAPTILQTGTAGPLYLDCTTGTATRKLDSSVSPTITTGLDVRVKVALPDWTPAATTYVIARNSGVDGSRGWYFGVNTAGFLVLASTSDGTAATLVSKNSTAATGFADGSTGWIRVTYTADNGAAGYDVKFYTSTDGVAWAQLGATVTTAGVRNLFANAAIGYELGGHSGVLSATGAAKIYEAQVRNGIDGPNVVPALPDLWPPYSAAAVQPVGAPVLTFVNGSHPGANIAYLNAAGRLAKLTPDYGQIATFLSDSHNEGLAVGEAWLNLLDGFRTATEQQVPGSPVTLLTQNPETSGTTWYREHARRRLDTIGYAGQKGLGLIDTYQAFLDAGWPGTLMADPVHPNADGSLVWRDAVLAQIVAQPVTAPAVVEVPTRYQLAVVYQARELYAAADRDGDVIGVGDYAIRSRPLTGAVKALLRPQSARFTVG